MPIDNDNVAEFLSELTELIDRYKTKINNAEALGCLKLVGDDISDKVRHAGSDPSPLS